MKKIWMILLMLLVSITGFSQSNEYQYYEKLDTEKVVKDVDTIKQEIDSTAYYVKGTFNILKEEVKMFGLKKTIQLNSHIFLPLAIFVILYLLWLKGRKRD